MSKYLIYGYIIGGNEVLEQDWFRKDGLLFSAIAANFHSIQQLLMSSCNLPHELANSKFFSSMKFLQATIFKMIHEKWRQNIQGLQHIKTKLFYQFNKTNRNYFGLNCIKAHDHWIWILCLGENDYYCPPTHKEIVSSIQCLFKCSYKLGNWNWDELKLNIWNCEHVGSNGHKTIAYQRKYRCHKARMELN